MTIVNTIEELGDFLRRIESGGWAIEYVETNGEKLRTEDPLHVQVGVSSPLLDTLQEESNVRIEGLAGECATTVLDVTIPAADEEDPSVESPSEAGRSGTDSDTSDDRFTNGAGELRAQTSELENSRPDEPEDPDLERDEPEEPMPARSETEGSTSENDEPEEPTSESDEPENSGPAHHDPDRLREVYAEHDTFAEMTDALGVDVSPQTVRHFMIRHGVHEPASHSSSTNSDTDTETDSGSESESEAERADPDRPTDDGSSRNDGEDSDTTQDDEERGSPDADTSSSDSSNDDVEPGPSDTPTPEPSSAPDDVVDVDQLEGADLPDGISIGDVKQAVESASTVYEVRRDLGLEGEETRELLRELDLLDLVTGRLAYKPNQDRSLDQIEPATASIEEIENRIRGALDHRTTARANGRYEAADVGGSYDSD